MQPLKLSFVLLMAVTGCARQISNDGDCAGAIVWADGACTLPCDAPDTPSVAAVDVSGCTFVEWSGGCATNRVCSTASAVGATFRRTAWPLQLDLSRAPDASFTVTPPGEACGPGCSLLPASEPFRIEVVPPSALRVEFEGDCTPSASVCTGFADRERRVAIALVPRDEYELTLEVRGRGSVSIDGQSCSPGPPCRATFPRGHVAHLEVVGQPQRTEAVWTSECGEQTSCELVIDRDFTFGVTLTPLFALTLDVSDGGSVQLAAAALRNDAGLWREGTALTLTATPEPNNTLTRLAGPNCTLPRDFHSCAFSIDRDTNVTVRFEPFYSWLVGNDWGLHVQVTDIVARDADRAIIWGTFSGDAFDAGPATDQNSWVGELMSDGGLGRVSVSQLGFDSLNMLETPDGGLWLAGGFFVRSGIGRALAWGGINLAPPDDALALVRFDESQFSPISATVIPTPRPFRPFVGRGPVLVVDAGLVTALTSANPLDGGPFAATSVVTLADDLSFSSTLAVGSAADIDLARFPFGDVIVSLDDVRASIPNACGGPGVDRRPFVSVLSQSACFAPTGVSGPSLPFAHVGQLPRRGARPVVTTTNDGLDGSPPRGVIASFNASLQEMWRSEFTVLETVDLIFEPVAAYDWGARVLSVFSVRRALGFRTMEGVELRCASATDRQLILVEHDALTGAFVWGVCIGNASLRELPRPDDHRTAYPVPAFGGLLISGTASRAEVFEWGSSQILFGPGSGGSSPMGFIGLVTPPR